MFELSTEREQRVRQVWVCPNCHGMRHLTDGTFFYNSRTGESDYRPGTKCWICNGTGRVFVEPAEGLT